jgi:hypothetical protein
MNQKPARYDDELLAKHSVELWVMVAVRAVNMCESSSKNNVENSEEIFSL